VAPHLALCSSKLRLLLQSCSSCSSHCRRDMQHPLLAPRPRPPLHYPHAPRAEQRLCRMRSPSTKRARGRSPVARRLHHKMKININYEIK
jgi:hypothetical protein